jgi:23S rRNA (cytidine2498-2'-O)-methyltransferase
MMIRAAYLAARDQATPLAEELKRRGAAVTAWHGRLALSSDPPVAASWALDIWTGPVELPVASVKVAADTLRAIQRNWSAYAAGHFRRIALIEARLPPVKAAPLVFPAPAPSAHLGAWTLLAPDRLLASPTKSSPFVNGECRFVEDRAGPPSRAYLKLWEACIRMGVWPGPGEVCLDLGASPGGWTWALARLGTRVIAVDKAPLATEVSEMDRVKTRQTDAFGVAPEKVDWLFSDVVAYPDRLLALVRRWIEADAAGRIVCTIKFQGETDHAAADAFAAIPGGRVMHLSHNKHELTFIWARPSTRGTGAGRPVPVDCGRSGPPHQGDNTP